MPVFDDTEDFTTPSKCEGCPWFDGTCKYYLFDGDDELPCDDH